MIFEEMLDRYARLLVFYALNVQPGQVVNITTEPIHRDLAIRVAKFAYEAGAKYVNLDLGDPRLGRVRVLGSKEENLAFVPDFIKRQYVELVDSRAANVRIIGSEEPDILADLDPGKINCMRLHRHLALKYFYDEGIGKSLIHWTIGAAATPKWGQKVFPRLSPDDACKRLWEEIFRICKLDRDDFLGAWREHNAVLQTRAKKLTEMHIKELHFSGPETDLRVSLSSNAIFKGGAEGGSLGVAFEPNIPTEEVFTTPDWRGTEGRVKTTRPFLINGKMIRDLYLEFKQGEISHFSASSGADTFQKYIESDDGAKRLGEVALVGIDSPIYKSGLVFEEILFDENAACHVAIGSAYKFCLKDGATMTSKQLEEVGCNESTVHTDMMISSEQVDVTATAVSGEKMPLIRKGAWVISA
ncbi:MAG: aminopeptidase [Deltaproteobacteria bacterium]|nr:aminopeptidase [Deltaproteobacteria bacterium]